MYTYDVAPVRTHAHCNTHCPTHNTNYCNTQCNTLCNLHCNIHCTIVTHKPGLRGVHKKRLGGLVPRDLRDPPCVLIFLKSKKGSDDDISLV